jgi:hypothetical protein
MGARQQNFTKWLQNYSTATVLGFEIPIQEGGVRVWLYGKPQVVRKANLKLYPRCQQKEKSIPAYARRIQPKYQVGALEEFQAWLERITRHTQTFAPPPPPPTTQRNLFSLASVRRIQVSTGWDQSQQKRCRQTARLWVGRKTWIYSAKKPVMRHSVYPACRSRLR